MFVQWQGCRNEDKQGLGTNAQRWLVGRLTRACRTFEIRGPRFDRVGFPSRLISANYDFPKNMARWRRAATGVSRAAEPAALQGLYARSGYVPILNLKDCAMPT